jgi:hypothetical protein
VVGNHEAADGDNFNRYRNQTWGEALGQVSSTATSALGHLLTKGLYLASGSHGVCTFFFLPSHSHTSSLSGWVVLKRAPSAHLEGGAPG